MYKYEKVMHKSHQTHCLMKKQIKKHTNVKKQEKIMNDNHQIICIKVKIKGQPQITNKKNIKHILVKKISKDIV